MNTFVNMIILSIKDFSITPGVRTSDEGSFSGEEYRTQILEPAFKKAVSNDEKIKVILDGTLGYATSFLEEVFGGLVRSYGFYKVKEHLEIVSDQRPFYLDDISEYMNDAKS